MNQQEQAVLPPISDKTYQLIGDFLPDLMRDELLSEVFAHTVQKTPHAIALECVRPDTQETQTLTYAQLDARSDALARGLIHHGAVPGQIIGLWMPRGIDLLVGQLAITKTGAAWLPFDADVAVERIATCLDDCNALALLTSSGIQDKAQAVVHQHIFTETDIILPEDHSIRIDARAAGTTAQNPAYLIYTSGSTGTPKGIVISHANICHFLRSANTIYGVHAHDIVFQGASLAFDLSMEEVWIPYMVGAKLWVATPQTMSDADQLPQVLTQAGITVMDTVPTLLGLLSQDIPSLRIIILGGEACPPTLAERWARPDRAIYNSYGPTEASVVATIDRVEVGQPVTIGRPIPNYTCYVLDENLVPVPQGTQGELVIGGAGIATGYFKRPDLTAEKFVANPFSIQGIDPVLYRSGDAVSLNAQGQLLFHGRIDDQVKIRGFRVELGEIEVKLSQLSGVHQASVLLRYDDGLERLVAFVVPQPDAVLDVPHLRRDLARQLPPYMVPQRFEQVAELPRLTSGKVNRKDLQTRPLETMAALDEQEAPENETQASLLAAAQQIFPNQTIPFDADFFTELGGHSLIAAKFISIIRQTPRFCGITMRDMYDGRSLRGIASLLAARGLSDETSDLSFEPPPFWRHFWCGLAQAITLPFILGLVTIQWLGLFLSSIFLMRNDVGFFEEMAILCGIYVTINLTVKLIIIALKWLILGRTKPGRYPLWGLYYFRVWVVQRLVQTTTPKFLQMSPLMSTWLRLLGAKVGKDAVIAEFEAGALDLIDIGDRVSTGSKVKLANVEFTANEMIIAPIVLKDDAYIGNSCVLSGGCVVEQGGELADLTCLLPDQQVKAWERWDGSPARLVGRVDASTWPAHPDASDATRMLHWLRYFATYTVMVMVGLVPIFPAFYVLYNLDAWVGGVTDYEIPWSQLLLFTWPTAIVLIVVSMAIIIALRWLVLPVVREGTYSIHSGFYYRKWTMALGTEVILETLNSLFATMYMRYWYIAMGTKIGKGSEISTNLAGRYDLVDIGEGNFIGDEAIYGDEEVRGGYMTLKSLKTGDRVFVGNGAIVPAGSILEDGALIGVFSKLPDHLHVKENETWFGSPALQLPTRQRVDLGAAATYEPPFHMKAARALFEAMHTSLPTALFIMLGYMTADIIQTPINNGNVLSALGVFLMAGVVIAVVLILASVAFKWLMMGVYKPVMKPMWSWWAMRTEACSVLYGGLVGKTSLEFARGTPFLPWVLKLYGTKIGKRVLMDWTDLTEFDCISIGDYAVINAHCCPQTHLYEDRVMKVGRIDIGKGVSVGSGSTILYDTKIGDFARIEPLTLIMKGENLPAHTIWHGAPAQALPSSHARH